MYGLPTPIITSFITYPIYILAIINTTNGILIAIPGSCAFVNTCRVPCASLQNAEYISLIEQKAVIPALIDSNQCPIVPSTLYAPYAISIIVSFEQNPVKNGVPINDNDPINIAVYVIGCLDIIAPIFLKSCSSANACITDPALKNNKALKNAWLNKWNKLAVYADTPHANTMYPNCEHVEQAITFLISFCTNPIVAPKKAVTAPTTAIVATTSGDPAHTGLVRNNKNTPAVTIVAACINADTGVGPSIASGNHVCNPICADFPIVPISNINPMIFPSTGVATVNSTEYSTDPQQL